MQTSLHIMALVAELKQQILGGTIKGAEFYKKERCAYFFIARGRSEQAIGFSYHPTGFGVLVAPAGGITVATSEKPRPVFDLQNATVTGIRQLGFDRIIELTIEKNGGAGYVVIEALGPNGNILWLDGDRIPKATLRRRELSDDAVYQPPPLPNKLNPTQLSADILRKYLDSPTAGRMSLVTFVEKNILGFDRLLAEEVAHRSGVEFLDVSQLTDDSLEIIIETVRTVVNQFERPEVGYLYRLGESVAVYPFKLTSYPRNPEKFETLSLSVLALSTLRRSQSDSADEQKQVDAAIERAVARLQQRRRKIEQDVAQAADYEHFKRLGDLLHIHFGKIKKGARRITVPDVFSDVEKKISVELDPALSPAQNVDAYFKKHRKGRQALELLRRRLLVTGQELARLSEIQSALRKNFVSARQLHSQELAQLLPKTASIRETKQRLPYRQFPLTSGVRVLVGRGGADNDRTTFEHASPHELWFHAQQCAGSHVVMKFPNKSFKPARTDIDEAAALAAWYSKARHNTLVPVIYTQRRYVRKPRKAKPGLVSVEREKSVMVRPRAPAAAAAD
ncbi:MAG TPA: NFACT family protein [Candidatus Deferrimicrobium sp.]|nr:NFACT family protein [Candidatus Deferrimicrobium sp.]